MADRRGVIRCSTCTARQGPLSHCIPKEKDTKPAYWRLFTIDAVVVAVNDEDDGDDNNDNDDDDYGVVDVSLL